MPLAVTSIMCRKRKRKTGKKKAESPSVDVVDITVEDLNRLVERIEQKAREDEDYDLILKVLRSYDYVMNLLRDDQLKLNRLKRLLFGSTESFDKVVSDAAGEETKSEDDSTGSSESNQDKSGTKGHGRRSADEYTGADEQIIEHESLSPGDTCPECGEGTIYEIPPQVVVRVTGKPPVDATVYRIQRLRCKVCGKLFKADLPADAQGEKYDEMAAAMIALLKYGSGLPFNRLERLEGNLGIPLPASTQWDVVNARIPGLRPAYEALIEEAAKWDLFHNDDTTVKILEKAGLTPPPVKSEKKRKQRTGTFTSTVVARTEGLDAALFFSGRLHAGENLTEVLRRRPAELATPMQMCDALSRNMPEELQTIVANCIAHGRRNFVDVIDSFPDEVKYVLSALKKVYQVDSEAKKRKLTPEKRLKLHRAKSGQVMAKLHSWLNQQLDDRLVEPNSGLGQAITYMLKHWEKLTLFLHVPGAPLDNNIAERSLKRSILHRKNSYFYKTANGAYAGDLYMTLIHTCELNQVNPYAYLVALMRHSEDVASHPAKWLPWNYRDRLSVLEESSTDDVASAPESEPAVCD